ncbi:MULTISPECIES: WecB/TagA/CpsF family glycosyltransferase [unclassified Methylophilus]|jgi:N-acetylglucosaminyldiphosphoundecaprenol N-acetyl-beta-D-mannosaminyltransferase|uniref:WecB/TagA/CpsF family glycosyltransferase n=1 Tax=unclassified Methylophilus TaxID=2630143 RepID=UPI0023B29F1E|nr:MULTISPECIES: WecB/TagA/CpsF family glycosyltransferase [unclassified Methylophilus]MDF0376811.1 WecB/TagA/CpsF family glycosyltransferase [Methylophilus sp. YYY-1]MDT7850710.1 WecB/TagA/CpsF family glycosyltransferase [Methylophilus sp. VKM B-3414]
MSNTIEMFGITIHKFSMNESVDVLQEWLQFGDNSCKYVVTPNVDHIVQLEKNPAFQQAYANAAMTVADGKPVVLASKLLGKPLPETVPGSDLVPNIFTRFQQNNLPLRVYLLGAMPGVGEVAAANIKAQWPVVEVVGILSPDFGFEKDSAYCDRICQSVADAKADLLVIGLGAPKQEIWVNKYANKLPVKVALCVGATIDFLAGNKPRAPMWMRRFGLEWMHRMCSEPKRLVKRYMVGAIIYPKLFMREWLKSKPHH